MGRRELLGELGDPAAQRLDLVLQLEDPGDAGEGYAFLLREALDLTEQCDVALGVAAPAPAGP